MVIDIKDYPVMRKKCSTCPFREDTMNRIKLANMVRSRLLSVSQICHHPSLSGKKQTHICRGARDFQIQIMHRLGVIHEQTDEAWDVARGRIANHSGGSTG